MQWRDIRPFWWDLQGWYGGVEVTFGHCPKERRFLFGCVPLVKEQPHRHSRQAENVASMIWGCSLTKKTLHNDLTDPQLWGCSMTMLAHIFQTIQKEQPHGSGTKLFMLNALLMHEICMKFFKNHILWTYMGIPYIFSPYYLSSAPSL